MPDHAQGQKNSDDVTRAYNHFMDLCDTHLPNNTALITDKAYAVSAKRSLWP